MTRVNLIPARRRQQRVLRARRRAWVVGVIAYATTLVVAYATWRVAWSGDDADRSRQLTLVRGDAEEAEKSVARVSAALNEVSLALRANQAVTLQPDWSLLLALVARLREEDVVLDRCGVEAGARPPGAVVSPATGQKPPEPAPPVIRLQGHARTQAAVSQFVLALERTGIFESVSILKANRDPFLGGEAMAFKIECQLRAGPAEIKPRPGKTSPRGGDLADLSEGANP